MPHQDPQDPRRRRVLRPINADEEGPTGPQGQAISRPRVLGPIEDTETGPEPASTVGPVSTGRGAPVAPRTGPLAQARSFGAGVESTFFPGLFTGAAAGLSALTAALPGGRSPSDAFQQTLGDAKASLARARTENPAEARLGQGVGLVGLIAASRALPGARAGGPLLPSTREGLLFGGAQGAVSGLTADENVPLPQAAENALRGGVGGALVGGALGSVAERALRRKRGLEALPGVAGRSPFSAPRRGAALLTEDAITTAQNLPEARIALAALDPEVRALTPGVAVLQKSTASRLREAFKLNPAEAKQFERAAQSLDDLQRNLGQRKQALLVQTAEDGTQFSPVIEDEQLLTLLRSAEEESEAFQVIAERARQVVQRRGRPVSVTSPFSGTVDEVAAKFGPDNLPETARKIQLARASAQEEATRAASLLDQETVQIPVNLTREELQAFQAGRLKAGAQFERPEGLVTVGLGGAVLETNLRQALGTLDKLPSGLRKQASQVLGDLKTQGQKALATEAKALQKQQALSSRIISAPFTEQRGPSLEFLDELIKGVRDAQKSKTLEPGAAAAARRLLGPIRERAGSLPGFGAEFEALQKKIGDTKTVLEGLEANTGVSKVRKGPERGRFRVPVSLTPEPALPTTTSRGVAGTAVGAINRSTLIGPLISSARGVRGAIRRGSTREAAGLLGRTGQEAQDVLAGLQTAVDASQVRVPRATGTVAGLLAAPPVASLLAGRRKRKKTRETVRRAPSDATRTP